MTEKLTRPGPPRAHRLRGRSVPHRADLRHHDDDRWTTLPACATVGDARARFASGGHGAYPIVDGDGRCVGIVSRNDLLLVDDDADGKPLARVRKRGRRLGAARGPRRDRAPTHVGRGGRAPAGARGRTSRRDLHSDRPAPNSCEAIRTRRTPARLAALAVQTAHGGLNREPAPSARPGRMRPSRHCERLPHLLGVVTDHTIHVA